MKNSKIIAVLLLLMGALVSCKKFLEMDPPTTILSSASVYDNPAIATGAELNIYSTMFGYCSLHSAMHAAMADEVTNYVSSWSNTYQNYYTPTVIDNDYWSVWYHFIYQANAVIEGVTGTSAIAPAIKNQLTGEALFVRAFWHFYLVNNYGEIPLITTTDYNVNGTLPRSSVETVYNQVVSDLKRAQSLLSTHYVDQSDTAVSTDRIRPNIAAATALLARVYLYEGKYDSAAMAATTLINDPSYSLPNDLTKVFLANSSEAIWQIATPTPNTIQTQSGHYFILLAAPDNGGFGNCFTISPQLMNSFESGDQRRYLWIDSISFTDPDPITYYYPYKYEVFDNSNNPNNRTEWEMVLRLAEQYLIRAEARAQTGDYNGAATDLNAIRQRAGLAPYAGALQKDELLAAILHERQVELFTEWGHRWFDLKRTGNINSVMSVVTPTKGGTWDPSGYQQLLPIPQSERNSDPNLSQNSGY